MKKRLIDNSANPSLRNYELDALKFLFTGLIFLHHTQGFIGQNTRFTLPLKLGNISVHFFFTVSGLLMANSILGKPQVQSNMSEKRQSINQLDMC